MLQCCFQKQSCKVCVRAGSSGRCLEMKPQQRLLAVSLKCAVASGPPVVNMCVNVARRRHVWVHRAPQRDTIHR